MNLWKLLEWPWSLITASFIVIAVIAVIAMIIRRSDRKFMAAAASTSAVGGDAPTATVRPANRAATSTVQTYVHSPLHEPKNPAPKLVRVLVLGFSGLLLWAAIYFTIDYVLSKANIGSFYTVILSCIGWIVFAVLAFKLFFRTISVYQVAHTQDMVTGKLRPYGAGTKLLLPWETLTEDKIVDTEARLINIPATKITTADGSPMLVSGQIRYRVAPTLSHRYIGVKKDDVEKSLLAVAIQLAREETARCADPEAAISRLPDTIDTRGNRVLGLISAIEDRFMNGPLMTRIENDHGVQVEGVPLSIIMAPETEKRFLDRLEDIRLAESATALLGEEKASLKERLEATRLALLNNPNARLTHTISEEQETGERTFTLNIGGVSGESLKGLAALGVILGKAFGTSQKQTGMEKTPEQHNQPQQQKGSHS